MLKREVTLVDVITFYDNLKKTNRSFNERVDDLGFGFITGGRILACVLAPSIEIAMANFASGVSTKDLKLSQLFQWLPEKVKYGKQDREEYVIKRYESCAYTNVFLLKVAIDRAFMEILFPVLHESIKSNNLGGQEEKLLQELCAKIDDNLTDYSLPSLHLTARSHSTTARSWVAGKCASKRVWKLK